MRKSRFLDVTSLKKRYFPDFWYLIETLTSKSKEEKNERIIEWNEWIVSWS